jgi:hypothetical protein
MKTMSSTNGKKAKKPTVTPEAAKILEQYRNAGSKLPAASGEESESGGAASAPVQRPAGPPASKTMRRSGTRGK